LECLPIVQRWLAENATNGLSMKLNSQSN